MFSGTKVKIVCLSPIIDVINIIFPLRYTFPVISFTHMLIYINIKKATIKALTIIGLEEKKVSNHLRLKLLPLNHQKLKTFSSKNYGNCEWVFLVYNKQ